MMYRVELFDPVRGSYASRRVEAENEAAASAMAATGGAVVVNVRAALSLRWAAAPRRFDAALFCHEFSRLLRAGMSVPEALEIQARRTTVAGSDYSRRLLRLVEEGKPLSGALEDMGVAPASLVAAVRASEKSGRVADALDEYASYERSLHELRRKLINSAIYPTLVVAFGGFVALFLLGYVVPRFAQVFDGTAAKLAWGTVQLLRVGALIGEHPFLVLGSLFATLLLAVLAARHPGIRGRVVSYCGSKWPFAEFVRKLQLARITRSMAMLLQNGFTVPAALALSSSQASTIAVRDAVAAALADVQRGMSLSAAFARTQVLDEYAARVVEAGERSGSLAAGFALLADIYRGDVETTLERTARVAEPLLLILVASLIGLIVVLMYAPIFDLVGSVG